MLRIERVVNGHERMLRGAGRLTGPWVAEFRRALAAEPETDVIVLDLTEISFADHDGLAFLLGLVADERVTLRCSPFLTEQLTTASKAKS
jgi:anti-anti-sigma regulatory factor